MGDSPTEGTTFCNKALPKQASGVSLNQFGSSSHPLCSDGAPQTSRPQVKKKLRARATVSEGSEGRNQQKGRQESELGVPGCHQLARWPWASPGLPGNQFSPAYNEGPEGGLGIGENGRPGSQAEVGLGNGWREEAGAGPDPGGSPTERHLAGPAQLGVLGPLHLLVG